MAVNRRPGPLFGVSLVPGSRNVEHLLEMARVADAVGLELLAIQDHPYNPTFLDTWTLYALIGGQTRHIKLLPDVLSLPLRPPAMLAKAAATLDLLTGGRVEMGLGAGAFWDGIAAMGGPRRAPGEAYGAFREAIEIMRLLWTSRPSQAINYQGQFYQLEAANAGPAPAHDISIWVGANGPRMMKLTGEIGDGLLISVAYVPPEKAVENNRLIDEAARAANRSPADIRRGYNVGGAIVSPAQANMRAARPGVLVGPPAQWVDTLASYYHDVGMDTFILWPAGGDDERQIRVFAEEIVPATKAALGVS